MKSMHRDRDKASAFFTNHGKLNSMKELIGILEWAYDVAMSKCSYKNQ